MPGIQSLPFELVSLVIRHLEVGELAAFARTSHKFFDIVDPELYQSAKRAATRFDTWHPIRWAAEKGQAGTMRKALAAGLDPEMLFRDNCDRTDYTKRLRQLRQQAIGRQVIPDSTATESDEEWLPDNDHLDADENVLEQLDTGGLDQLGLIESATEESDGSNDLGSEDEYLDDVLDHFEHVGTDPVDGGAYNAYLGPNMPHFRALHLAAARGHDEVIQALLQHGVAIDSRCLDTCDCTFNGPRMLGSAAVDSEAQQSRRGISALHLAICFLQKSTVRLLLSWGASIQLTGLDSPVTALHSAAATGQSDLCQLLLDNGYIQDVDILDSNKLSPFYWAYFNGHWDTTVPFLLERGANIDFQIPCDLASITSTEHTLTCTILYEAIYCGRFEDAIKLIHLGANVNQGSYSDTEQRSTPLHAASMSSVLMFSEPLYNSPVKLSHDADEEHLRTNLLNLLLQAGAKIDARSPEEDGWTPLHQAARHKLIEAFETLLAAGANVEEQDSVGKTALLIVCLPPWGGWSPIEDASLWEAHKELHMIRLLLDHGARINATDDRGQTALHLICSADDPFWGNRAPRAELLRLLLDHGASPTARCQSGKTPFQVAYRNGALDICDILLRRHKPRQALKHHELDEMWTHSLQNRPSNIEIFNLLYDLDTEGYLWKSSKYVMLYIAGRYYELAWTYLRRKLPPLSPREKSAVLHPAIRKCQVDIIKRMIAIKTPINLPDINGTVPLSSLMHVIDESGMRPLLEVFLAAGADPHHQHTSHSQATPLEEAMKQSSYTVEIVEIMLRHSPLTDDMKTKQGNYLHTAVKYDTLKPLFDLLIEAGAEVTALDGNGNTPLAVYLKRLVEKPQMLSPQSASDDFYCLPIWYLWDKAIDIERKNKSGKSILSYLTALRLYRGECKRRAKAAEILRTRIKVVPLPGDDGRRTLCFSSWFAKKDRVIG